MRETIHTLGRAIICIASIWALELGSYSIPISTGAALLVATAVGMLTVYELAIRDVRPVWLAVVLVVIFAVILEGFAFVRSRQPPTPTGPLRPAGEPTPAISCRERPGPHDLVMVFGTDTLIGKGDGPFTPFRLAACRFLSLKRTPKGLNVSDVGYDYDNDIAFMVRDGVYTPTLVPMELRVVRPDPSTYILLDRFNQEVIYVRYLNRNAVRIRGRVLCGESPQAVVLDDRILLGGIRVGGVTFGQHRAPGNVCMTAPSPPPPPPLVPSWLPSRHR